MGRIGRCLKIAFGVTVMLMLPVGCSSFSQNAGPYQPAAETARNPLEAQRLTQAAMEVIDADPGQAERLLREALTADLYHGPAHNDLGVLYLQRGDLYSAASEFEWARRLMPGHPDPRLNLALTLERAGRIDDALTEYGSALEVYPGHIQTLQARSRCVLRYRFEDARADPTLPSDLREISLRGETAPWREWAQAQLIRLESRSRP